LSIEYIVKGFTLSRMIHCHCLTRLTHHSSFDMVYDSANMQRIDTDKVNAGDTTYCISYPLDDDLLLSSIMRSGILMPIALLSSENPVPVTGFKRVAAARKLGIREIPCVFLDVDERQALLTAILDNLKRPLNTIEKARCIERMAAYAFPTSQIVEMMKLIGLPARERTIETASAAVMMDEKTKALIVRCGLPMTAIEQLVWFGPEDCGRLVDIIDTLDVTVSSFREIMQLAMIIKARKGDIDFRRLTGASTMSGLKRRLKTISNPLLTEMESALDRLLKSCALPPTVKLHVDPYFERDWIDISVRARNADEMGNALRKLEHLVDQGTFGSIFDLTHGLSNRN